MSTMPELLTLYQEAVKLSESLPEQTIDILNKITSDPNCSMQLQMTAAKLLASMTAKSRTDLVKGIVEENKPKLSILKDSILTVDVFAIEAIPHIEGRMPIAPEQYDRLKEDVKKRGIQIPLIVTPDFKLLCGYNRLKIAKELDLKTVPVIVKHITVDKLVEFAVKDNIVRRHLTLKELAEYIAAETTQTVGRPKRGSRSKTIQDISAALGVSTATVSRAKSFVKKVKKDPALANRSIKSVVEGTEPQDHISLATTFTVGVDLDDEKVSEYFASVVDQIYGLDLNNGDKIKIVAQAWHVRRK